MTFSFVVDGQHFKLRQGELFAVHLYINRLSIFLHLPPPVLSFPHSRSFPMKDEAPEPSGLASDSGFPFGNAEAPLSPRASVYSYASSIDKHFVIRELYGRMVNNTNEVRGAFRFARKGEVIQFLAFPALRDSRYNCQLFNAFEFS